MRLSSSMSSSNSVQQTRRWSSYWRMRFYTTATYQLSSQRSSAQQRASTLQISASQQHFSWSQLHSNRSNHSSFTTLLLWSWSMTGFHWALNDLSKRENLYRTPTSPTDSNGCTACLSTIPRLSSSKSSTVCSAAIPSSENLLHRLSSAVHLMISSRELSKSANSSMMTINRIFTMKKIRAWTRLEALRLKSSRVKCTLE